MYRSDPKSGVVLIATALLTPVAADAAPRRATCLLQVAGKTYINGPCTFDALGRFGFQVKGLTGDYFAFVIYGGGGKWNEQKGSRLARTSLGVLRRDPADAACWANEEARVCAWMP